jgi:hypothetical protein
MKGAGAQRGTLVKALARAWLWQKLLDHGVPCKLTALQWPADPNSVEQPHAAVGARCSRQTCTCLLIGTDEAQALRKYRIDLPEAGESAFRDPAFGPTITQAKSLAQRAGQ